MVADGVGGAVAGEVASATVASAFAEVEHRSLDTDPYRVLAEAVELSTDRLAALLREQPDLEGMGTTATAMIVSAKRLVFAQIGDSRAYYLPGRGEPALHQVTRDDSFVQYLIEAGTITSAQAWRHPKRHVILKALNGMSVSPTFSTYAALAGDRYLLCSDGLSDVVPAGAHRAAAPGHRGPRRGCRDVARRRAGRRRPGQCHRRGRRPRAHRATPDGQVLTEPELGAPTQPLPVT